MWIRSSCFTNRANSTRRFPSRSELSPAQGPSEEEPGRLRHQVSDNLGMLYKETSAYEKAEPMLLEALEIRGKVLGKTQPGYALSLHNLGHFYHATHAYEKAEPLLLQA